jgi:hypothetical protein
VSVEKLEQAFFEDIRRTARPQSAVVKFWNFGKSSEPVRFCVKKVEQCGVEKEKS